jgi:hypothetical protein
MGHVGLSKKKYLALQARDLELLRWVAVQKFATRAQLAVRFFPNEKVDVKRPERVCYRRLLSMVHFGLLETRHVVTDSVQLYQVGRAGLRELEHRQENVLPYLPAIDLKNFEHDRRVNEFRISIEQLGVSDWQSERQLHQAGFRGHVPDGTFTLGENRCALEMELSQKRLDRYPAILQRYIANQVDRFNVVFYLCGTPAVRDAISKVAGDTRRFCFALWEEFLKSGVQTRFENSHSSVSLAELA